jgi:hypothetical protein
MQWIAISGSWRKFNADVERDVRAAVAEVMARGDGIVTGGALGVDSIAVSEALKHNPTADRIKIILPSSFATYARHFRKRAQEGVITTEQAETLIALIADVQRRHKPSVVEMSHRVLNEATYYERNTKILEGISELLAFQVNGSAGTQDAIDKARQAGLAVRVKSYALT